MKAFTVYQPFAYAIVAGLKGYETRPRRTNIRGRVAVHAGKRFFTFDTDAERAAVSDLLDFEPWKYHTEDSGHSAEFDRIYAGCAGLPHGAVIGTVEIVDCVPVEEIENTLTERERLLGDYSPGRFAWVLKNPVMFDTPIPARGQQGWWNIGGMSRE